MNGGSLIMTRNAIILAAGQGTRMKSKLPKVLHPILGQPMIEYIIKALHANEIKEKVTVIGHGADLVKETIGDQCQFVFQKEQLGTAHAVLQAESILKEKKGTTIVVAGDTPLIRPETFSALIAYHEKTGSAATVLTANMEEPFGYGRIVRDIEGEVERIVEQKDASPNEQAITEINTATYCFDNEALFEGLQHVNNDNKQGEYYLTDLVEIFRQAGKKVSAYVAEDAEETSGINDRVALVDATTLMKRRINEAHLLNGVTIEDPNQTYIGPEVTIDQDVIIKPGSIISGQTHISEGSIIGPHTEIEDCHIGAFSVIRQSTVFNSKIGNKADIGPFSHIRPETELGEQVKVGNFVEVKKSTVGDNTKLAHLNYVGDATLGKNINVGCGAITVNYDGVNKHETIIEDDSFIGCNVNLIAPVTVEKGSIVAAGSTINKNVPADSLAIARGKQTNKEGYASKLYKKQSD